MESFYYAVWNKSCWKCGREITVALDVCGWSFVPCDTLEYEEYEDEESIAGGLWRYKMPSWLLKHLRSLGLTFGSGRLLWLKVATTLTFVPIVEQFKVHEEFAGLLYENPPRFKVYKINEEGPEIYRMGC